MSFVLSWNGARNYINIEWKQSETKHYEQTRKVCGYKDLSQQQTFRHDDYHHRFHAGDTAQITPLFKIQTRTKYPPKTLRGEEDKDE